MKCASATCNQESGGQALAPLGPTTLDDHASGLGGHTRTETVAALTLYDAGLERTLHGNTRNSIHGRQAKKRARILEKSWAQFNLGPTIAKAGFSESPRDAAAIFNVQPV